MKNSLHSIRTRSIIFCLALLSGGINICCAADESPAFTDAIEAGKDFRIQGEYLGTVQSDTWGVQVIALGNGKFRCVGYPGGLPGDGYTPGTEKKEIEGALDGETAVFLGDKYRLEIADDQLKIKSNEDSETLGTLKRIRRESATLGQKPSQGAVVLFNGTGADAFENGKMTEDKLLQADCSSREKFGDHFMHIEFRTPFKPLARGQARGNSGVYIQSRYELQVLDSFGLSGENNECGGFYQIAKPSVNMCYPPLSWQTYDIEFTAAKYDNDGKKIKNARATIKHNGVLIHQDVELKSGTPGRHPEGQAPDSLYLQGHGNPVHFRNIWVIKRT